MSNVIPLRPTTTYTCCYCGKRLLVPGKTYSIACKDGESHWHISRPKELLEVVNE